MTTILDPTDERVPVNREPTRRPEHVTGTVGLLDISKPGGRVFLDRLEHLLRARCGVGQVVRVAKPTFAKPAPETVIAELLRARCDGVIEALAD